MPSKKPKDLSVSNLEAFVQRDIHFWALQNRWSLEVYDCRMIPSGGTMRTNPGICVGHSDMAGFDSRGHAVYIELKKKRRRGLCRLEQYLFLHKKISAGAFGLVTDAPEHLEEIYRKWLSCENKVEFLLQNLPRKVLAGNRVISSPT